MYKQSRDDLITQYATLVKRIAHHMMARLPSSVQVEDLIQAGMIGLLEASSKFDASKGASFETFAGIRIRGAMIDEIRRGDWVPRSVHRNARKISEVMAQLEQETGTTPKDSDIAERMGVPIDQYHAMLKDANNGFMVGFDDLGISEDFFDQGLSEQPTNPYKNVKAAAFQEHLTQAIEELPEKEKIILSLYYDEELNLKEIGKVLGISESRVSQINSQAMIRLRSKMEQWVEANVAEFS